MHVGKHHIDREPNVRIFRVVTESVREPFVDREVIPRRVPIPGADNRPRRKRGLHTLVALAVKGLLFGLQPLLPRRGSTQLK